LLNRIFIEEAYLRVRDTKQKNNNVIARIAQ